MWNVACLLLCLLVVHLHNIILIRQSPWGTVLGQNLLHDFCCSRPNSTRTNFLFSPGYSKLLKCKFAFLMQNRFAVWRSRQVLTRTEINILGVRFSAELCHLEFGGEASIITQCCFKARNKNRNSQSTWHTFRWFRKSANLMEPRNGH